MLVERNTGPKKWTWAEISQGSVPVTTTRVVRSNAAVKRGYVGVIPEIKPKRDRLVITVAVGAEFNELIQLNRSIEAYANRIDADYVELTEQTQEWWGYEKFRVFEFAKRYERMLFVDADCIIADTCPDVFDLLGDFDMAMHDDFALLPSIEWMNDARRLVFESQSMEHWNPEQCLNSGFVISKRDAAEIWKPPPFPLPEHHCAEQFWVEWQCSNRKVLRLPTVFNRQWWMNDFATEPAFVRHWANCPNRVEEFSKLFAVPDCMFRKNQCCEIISGLAETEYFPSPKECRGCSRFGVGVNDLTRMVASVLRSESGLSPLLEAAGGPGTRLKAWLSWFASESNCGCGERASIMDAWGVEGCRRNKSLILGWMREGAAKEGLPYNEIGMRLLLELVLRSSG